MILPAACLLRLAGLNPVETPLGAKEKHGEIPSFVLGCGLRTSAGEPVDFCRCLCQFAPHPYILSTLKLWLSLPQGCCAGVL